jgi:hypothetical protein
MNYNILTYLFYFLIILFVVLYVGHVLYKNGRPFLVNTFSGNEHLADAVNKFLLAGYYLTNIGYTIIALKVWEKVESPIQFLNVLSHKIGAIVLTLGIMHFINIFSLIIIGRKKRFIASHPHPDSYRDSKSGSQQINFNN